MSTQFRPQEGKPEEIGFRCIDFPDTCCVLPNDLVERPATIARAAARRGPRPTHGPLERVVRFHFTVTLRTASLGKTSLSPSSRSPSTLSERVNIRPPSRGRLQFVIVAPARSLSSRSLDWKRDQRHDWLRYWQYGQVPSSRVGAATLTIRKDDIGASALVGDNPSRCLAIARTKHVRRLTWTVPNDELQRIVGKL